MAESADFTIRCPREVIFGWNALSQLPERAAALGNKPMLAVGTGFLRETGRLEGIIDGLEDAGLVVVAFEGIEHDPSVETIDGGRQQFRDNGCDSMIAVGGGSIMDAGKAIAGLSNEADPTADFVAGKPIEAKAPPIICCTTTAGTGSEVTHVAVLSDTSRNLKASIRTDDMMPTVAIVDPEITLTLPKQQTAYTGLDAFVQAIESWVSRGANPYSDPIALQATAYIARSLRTAYEEPSQRQARQGMSLGSMLAGLALASARLGLVHGLAHPLGALYGLAHGEACGLLLPHVMNFNASHAADKYAAAARAANVSSKSDNRQATMDLIRWTQQLCRDLGCSRPFADFGLKREDYPQVIEAAMKSGSTAANPRKVTENAIAELLDEAM